MSKASKPCEGVEPESRRWITREQSELLSTITDWSGALSPTFGLLRELEGLYMEPPEYMRRQTNDQFDALRYALNSAPWAEALRDEE